MDGNAPAASTSLIWFLFASMLVIGLALAATRLLARWQFAYGKGRRMRVLEGLAVGRDRHLMLVQVGKEILVVGSAEQGVSLVCRVEDPELIRQCLEEPVADPAANVSLAGLESSVRANLDRIRGLLVKNRGRGDA